MRKNRVRGYLIGLVFSLICLLADTQIYSCTGFFAVSGQRLLFAHNEDYHWTDCAVRIRPPANGHYGYLYVGFMRLDGAFGGINDAGLVLDSFANPECNWQEDPDKIGFSGDWFQHLLRSCASVEEVADFCRRYNLPYFRYNHLFGADRQGNSIVIEWGGEKVEVIRKQGEYQVVTNFFLLHPEWGWYPCWRYDTVTEMLDESSEISPEVCRSILDAVHVNTTQYSNIYEVLQGNIYYFNHHNFDEYLKFNLDDEMARGMNNYLISNYISNISLEAPEEGQQLNPSRVECSWRGKTDSRYQFHYSINPNLSNAVVLEINNPPTPPDPGVPAGLLLLGVIPLGLGFGSKSKLRIALILLLPLVLMIPCCDSFEDEFHGLIKEFSVELENLEPDTTYYWKITAVAGAPLTSQSITRSFSTLATGTGSE